MIGILQRYGETVGSVPDHLQAADRKSKRTDMSPFSFVTDRTSSKVRKRRFRKAPADLIRLSESLLPSRAIRLIRGGVSFLEYGLQPNRMLDDEVDPAVIDQAIRDVRTVLDNPNEEDDFGQFVGMDVEDLMIFDIGVWEYVEKPTTMPGVNEILALYPVAGHSIAELKDWNGSPDRDRWAQIQETRSSTKIEVIPFTHDDLEVIMQRRRSFRPHGISQLETVVDVMESWLGLTAYQSEVASNSYPNIWIYVGNNADEAQVNQLRAYWEMDMKGRGTPGIFGNMEGDPKVLELKPSRDEALYPKYEEKLIRSLAFGFDLKPQDFNIERDVNRSTAEVSASKSVEEARKPPALLLAKVINRRLLPRIARITGNEMIKELEFFWVGIDPSDDSAVSEIHERYLKTDVLKIDEVRSDLDQPPLPSGLGNMTLTGFQEFMKHDFGGSLIFDQDDGALEEIFTKISGFADDREALSEVLLSDDIVAKMKQILRPKRSRVYLSSSRIKRFKT